MNSSNILNCLTADEHANLLFEGVFPRDKFIDKLEKGRGNRFYVFNTHDSSKDGEHWVAAQYTKDRLEVFDTFGRNPHFLEDVCEKTETLMKREQTHWNDRQVQGITTSTGGDYCVLARLLLAREWTLKEIVDTLLSTQGTELRDHGIRRFIIIRYGEDAVGELSVHSGELMGFDGVLMGSNGICPLVMTDIIMENGH